MSGQLFPALLSAGDRGAEEKGLLLRRLVADGRQMVRARLELRNERIFGNERNFQKAVLGCRLAVAGQLMRILLV